MIVSSAPAAENASSIPALSGHWGRTNFNMEQPQSGPAFIANTMKKPDGTIADDAARVGDFTNPILTPEGAAILKAHGEFSRAGNSIPDPHNQCWPEPPPFVMNIQVEVLLLQKKDSVTLIYVNGQIVRHVRLNVPHPERVTPTWLGDSVGRYEGDTLVIDTIGIKPQGPLAVIDRYGTPHSDALHVVERYRLIDGARSRGRDAQAPPHIHRRSGDRALRHLRRGVRLGHRQEGASGRSHRGRSQDLHAAVDRATDVPADDAMAGDGVRREPARIPRPRPRRSDR